MSEHGPFDALLDMSRSIQQEPSGAGRLAPQAPTQSGAPYSKATPIGLPEVNYPPTGAQPVDEPGDASVAPAATATLITIEVPVNRQLRLDGIGFGADDEIALAFLTWSIYEDANPAPAYYAQAATIGEIVHPAQIFLHVAGPKRVTLRVTPSALAVVTYRYIARLKGWLYGQQIGV